MRIAHAVSGGCYHDDERLIRKDKDLVPAVTRAIPGLIVFPAHMVFLIPEEITVVLIGPVWQGVIFCEGLLYPFGREDLLPLPYPAILIQLTILRKIQRLQPDA